jgi:hypothetical protein
MHMHRNRKLLSKFIIFTVHIQFMYTSHMQKEFPEYFIIWLKFDRKCVFYSFELYEILKVYQLIEFTSDRLNFFCEMFNIINSTFLWKHFFEFRFCFFRKKKLSKFFFIFFLKENLFYNYFDKLILNSTLSRQNFSEYVFGCRIIGKKRFVTFKALKLHNEHYFC